MCVAIAVCVCAGPEPSGAEAASRVAAACGGRARRGAPRCADPMPREPRARRAPLLLALALACLLRVRLLNLHFPHLEEPDRTLIPQQNFGNYPNA